jgi:curved DNA-binding protein
MEYKDYYKILGVWRKASSDEIQRAFRKLARKYLSSVGKVANAEECFKEVKKFCKVLKDSEKQQPYDQLCSNWPGGQEFRPPPGWDQQFHYRAKGGVGVVGLTPKRPRQSPN